LKKETTVQKLIKRAREKEIDPISSDEEEEYRKLEKQIVLEQTKITFAIVSKFYL